MHTRIQKIQEYLLLIIPLLLITGPFLPDLALSIMCIIFLIEKIYKKEFNILKIDLFGKVFFLWCLYLVILSSLSQNPYLSFESSLFFFRFGVFAYAVKATILNNPDYIKKFFYFLTFIILFVIIDGYSQYFFGKNFFGYSYEGHRLTLFDDTKFIGHYLARLLPIIIAVAISHFLNSKILLLLISLIFISADVLIFLSGERTSFFILSLFTFIILALISKWKIVRLATIIISTIVIIIIVRSDSIVKGRMVTQTINQTGAGVTFSPEHDLLFESSFNIFLDHKYFGVGPKLFRSLCSDKKYARDIFGYRDTITSWDETNSCNTHPHNMYLQLLAETGIIGTLPVIIFFLYLSFLLFRQFLSILFKKKYIFDDFVICLTASIFVQLWPIMPHLSVFNNRVNVFIFLTIGLLMTSQYFKRK
tara:strand:- start:398 stop:1657 length:1260 start_codon:yes stop_codon:yes gene_type:complete